jgi:hypothetical protein
MSNPDIAMLVGGIIAVILGGIDALRATPAAPPSLTALGVVVLGVVFILVALA